VIRVERIERDIAAIARFTQTPGAGADRPTFSRAWGDAMEYVADQARQAGCEWKIDAAGNGHARPAPLGWEKPAWMCGSHIDSVPHGGDYDGVAGVVVGLEILRSAKDEGIARAPVELIVFAEEEGTTFGLGMIGSRLWVGELGEESLRELRNSEGKNYFEAGKEYGVDLQRLADDRIEPVQYLGLAEVHIEQGPSMWQEDERLGVVLGISGRRQYLIRFDGVANHAGTTPMRLRRDALCGAAEFASALEEMAGDISRRTVATVGRLVNYPNAINVVPDRVEFTVDLRAPEDGFLERGDADVRRMVEEICRRRNLKWTVQQTESIAACPMDVRLVERLLESAHAAGVKIAEAHSGALHDSAVMAPHVPTAMLFVPSRDGISHNPAEFSRVEDIAAAAKVVEKLVRRPTVGQLNEMDEAEFVSVCGGAFERSPWIAQRAWAQRPFASVGDLHEKMTGVVKQSSAQEKLALVRAHPDLVGRLAREGRLTRESNAEQAAAGLTALSEPEIAAFEKFNTQYREKFGFPFVICARQNRKEAILAAFPKRLDNSRETELATALGEVFKIAQLRLADAVWES